MLKSLISCFHYFLLYSSGFSDIQIQQLVEKVSLPHSGLSSVHVASTDPSTLSGYMLSSWDSILLEIKIAPFAILRVSFPGMSLPTTSERPCFFSKGFLFLMWQII